MTGWSRSAFATGLLALAGCAPPAEQVTGQIAMETPRLRAAPDRSPYIRVVGTAQDGGFPHAACEHQACRRIRDGQAPRRLISSLALIIPKNEQVFLFDATPDIREQLDALRDVRTLPADRVDRSPLDGVFLTHAHIGHYLGLAFFGFEAVHTQQLAVWATPRMSDFLRRDGPWSQLVAMGNLALQPLTAEQPVQLADNLTVTPFAVPHRDELSDTVGYIIRGPNRSLAFVPDTDKWATWQPALTERLAEVDIALLDGSFFSADELPGRSIDEIGHPMIGTTMDLLESAVGDGELEVHFIHLNHSNPALLEGSDARRQVEAGGFGVAFEGQEFSL